MPLPVNPGKPDWSNKEEVQKYQDEKADYNFALQAMQQARTEESAIRSNIAKSEHDAMMIIANNMKA